MKSFYKTLMLAMALCLSWAVNAQTPATVPYSCGFEDATENAEWVLNSGTGSFTIGTSYAHTGTNGLYVDSYNASTGYYAVREITLAAGEYAISYFWKGTGESIYDWGRVYLVPSSITPSSNGNTSWDTGGPSGWIGIDANTRLNQTSSWTEWVGTVNITSAGNYKIVVFFSSDASNQNAPGFCFDDLSITANTCPAVANLGVAESDWDNYDFTFNWHGVAEANGYNVVFSETAVTDFENATIDNITDTFYSVTGLTPATTYHLYVQTDCGSDDASRWSHLEFTTSQQYIMAATGTATLDNACGYTIYDDGGPNGQYSTSCSSTLILNPPAGQLLTISGTYTGEGCCDYLKIYDGAGTSGTMLCNISSPSSGVPVTVGPFISEEGSLTIQFTSDGSICYDGFELQVGCVSNTCPRPYSASVADLTSDEATIVWNPRGEETTWDVFVGTDTVQVTDNFYTFTGLTPNTPYTYGVRAVCADDDMSRWIVGEFRTACLPIDELPFTEGFESYTTGASDDFIPCWYRSGYNQRPYVYSGNANTGSKSLYFYSGNTANDYDAAIMPPIDGSMFNISDLAVSFYARQYSTSYNCDVVVGIMENPSDMSTFVPVGTVHPNGTAYEYFEVVFANYEGTGTYVAFKVVSHPGAGSYCYMYIDDITLDYAPDCMRVDSLQLEVLSSTSIAATWVPVGSESEWSVVLSEGNNVVDYQIVSSPDITWTDLQPSTLYTVAVSAYCGSDSSSTNVAQIRTACYDFLPLPYNYGFEDLTASQSPICGYVGRLNTTTAMPYASSTGTAYNGSWNLYMYTAGGATPLYWYAVGPIDLDETPLEDLFVRFVHGSAPYTGSYSSIVRVGLMENPNDLNTFVEIANFNSGTPSVSGTCNWNEREVYFSNLDDSLANYAYIAFATPVMPALSNYTIIDDIHVDLAPACPRPTIVSATNVTANEATIHWNGGTAPFYVYYGTPVADTTENATPIVVYDADSVDLTDLMSNTVYQVFVQADCGGELSEISSAFTFRTECGDQYLPYTENFDSYVGPTGTGNMMPCWTILQTPGTYPYITTGTYARSGYGIQFGGGSGSTYARVATPRIMCPANEIVLDFWKKSETTSGSSGSLLVGWTSTLTSLDSIILVGTFAANTAWQHHELDFSTVAAIADRADTGYVVFWPNGTSTIWYTGLDDVHFEQINPCAKPATLTASNVTADEADITWSEVSGSNGYNLIISATPVIDFENYDGNVENLTTNSFHADQLNANTLYYVYVQNDCGDGLSNWNDITFRTACNAIPHAELPYTYGFEDATVASSNGTINPCWRKYTDNSTAYPYPSSSYRHNGTYSLYFYSTTTPYYSYAVMPLFEDSINTLMLNFWRYGGSSVYGRIKVGVMTDPDEKSTFVPVAIFNDPIADANWHEEMVDFSTYTGHGRYIAFMADFTDNFTYTYIDDITVKPIPSCAFARNLTVDATTAGSALLSWQAFGQDAAIDQADYSLTYWETADPTSAITINPTEPFAAITGLDNNTAYTVVLVSTCNDDTTAVLTTTFTTRSLPCAQEDPNATATVTIGTGTGTSSYLPSTSTYNYGLSEQIYLASEFNGNSGTISSLTFNMSAIQQTRGPWKIYLGHTSQSSMTGMFTPNDLTLVFDGPQNLVVGANTFNFTTPFSYNGSDNLVVIFFDDFGSWSSGNAGVTHTTTGTLAYYKYQDSPGAYSLSDLTGGNSTSGARLNMTFQMTGCLQQASCTNPIVMVDSTNTNSIFISMLPGYQETSWDVYYAPAGDTNWTMAGTATSSNFTVTGLQPSTYYDVRVASACDGTEFSTIVTTATGCGIIAVTPTQPYFEGFEAGAPVCYNNDHTTGTVDWVMGQVTHYTGGWSGTENAAEVAGALQPSATLTTDIFDFTALGNDGARLRFQYIGMLYSDGNQPKLNISYRTSANDPWTLIDSIVDPQQAIAWREYLLPASAGANWYQLGFSVENNSSLGVQIDDITIDQAPACPRPTHLAFNGYAANGNAQFTWNGESNNYELQYRLVNDTAAGWTTVTASTTSASVALPGGHYELRVFGICGTDRSDASNFAYLFVPCAAQSLPYTENFNSYTNGLSYIANGSFYTDDYPYVDLPSCWIFPNQSHANVRPAAMLFNDQANSGFATNCLWINARVGYDHYSVLPLMDAPIDTLALRFDYASTTNEVIEVGVMTDPYDITTFTSLQTFTASNSSALVFFSSYNYPFVNGQDYYIALHTSGDYYTFIDNVEVDYMPSCVPMDNLSVVSADANGVTLSWSDPNNAGTWQIATGTSEPNLATIQTVTSNPGTYTGLGCGTHNLWVRANCSATEQNYWLGPVSAMVVTATTSYNMPTGSNVWDTVTDCCFMVYDNGGSNGDYATYQSSYLVLMPGEPGAMMSVSGIITQMESSSYDYLQIYDGIGTDGTQLWAWNTSGSNIAVPLCTSTTGPLTLYFHSDGTLCYSGFELLASCTSTAPICHAPALSEATNVDYQGATINWTGEGEDYEVAIRTATGWSAETAVNGYSYTFSGLNAATTYQYRVRQDCNADSIGYSDWAVGQFTTDSLPCFAPTNVEAINIAGTTADITWTPGSTENTWEVMYSTQGEDLTVIVTEAVAHLTDLRNPADYTVKVRAICGNGIDTSDWSETATFSTILCEPVSGIAFSNITTNSATVTWTSNGPATTWTVNFGYANHYTDEAIHTYTVEGTPTLELTGLSANTSYDVYIQAVCAEGWVSDEVHSQPFSTLDEQQEGIDQANATAISLYPNPATSEVTIEGYEGEVVIVDMTGRVVITTSEKTIDIRSLSAGAYFVKLGTEVKKLIVK